MLAFRIRLLTICVGLLVVPTALGQGAKTEHRTFRVKVEEREAGLYKQTITTYGEGTIDVATQGDVKVKFLGMTFQFAYRGQERWKDGRLIYLASASNDDGKTHTLMVTAEQNGLKIKESGKERLAPPDTWSTSYWTLPPADRRLKPLLFIDADSGQEYRVQWQNLGKVMVPVGQQRVACTHYKVTGSVELELWFDENDRLVRRDMLRKGKKTVMELVSATVN
jgi:hypothetical protein